MDERAISPCSSEVGWKDRWDHVEARVGYRRSSHRVKPGLYSLGAPSRSSPVFVTANYTLSFDALRSSLRGMDAHILVLDTHGINVWCAAGEGTFGTEEVVHRVHDTSLEDIVDHRMLILPQLGAPGVSAHEVKSKTGFRVEFGPVRAADLPEYLKLGKATPEMRTVKFGLKDRLVLVPVEITHSLPYLTVAAIAVYLLGGLFAVAMVLTSVMAGIALFPILLPWLPTRDFSSRGFILGAMVMLPFAFVLITRPSGRNAWIRVFNVVGLLLVYSSVTAFLALNFTGSTTFTSRTGVRREIFRYVPIIAASFFIGLVLNILSTMLKGGP